MLGEGGCVRRQRGGDGAGGIGACEGRVLEAQGPVAERCGESRRRRCVAHVQSVVGFGAACSAAD